MIKRFVSVGLSKRHGALEIGGLSGCDQLAAAGTTALLNALVAQQVAVPRRATQEFTGACQLETFGDGFTCFRHGKCRKKDENIALPDACKA